MQDIGAEARRRTRALVGRDGEEKALEAFLAAVRRGESRALVMEGEAGVGKTALLDWLSEQASGCRVVSIAGVQAEMELPFASLHQLCAPILDCLPQLPAPQRAALEVTFGISAGRPSEPLLLGLAVLTLLSEAAVEQPLVCLVDDVQWLDPASAQVIAFAARRLGAESVGIAFATRRRGPELSGLPVLEVEGLRDTDARRLLATVLTQSIDGRAREQLIIEAGGNPLALLELSRGLLEGQFAGGYGLRHSPALSDAIEERFIRQIESLPQATQRLLLLAAADPLGDPLVLWRAAQRLGIDTAADSPAVELDLVSFGSRVRFRHPLVRSAVYRSASMEAKREVHAALAEVIDPAIEPERRAWHRAEAIDGANEEVAAELERYSDLAQSRGGLAAAAAFLERATVLSPEPEVRATRALAAGGAKVQAGDYTSAANLLAMADAGPLDELGRARLDLVRAQLAFATSRGRDAPLLLLKAARRLESIDGVAARATYLEALAAASLALGFADPQADVRGIARSVAQAAPSRGEPSPADLLLDGLVAVFNEGYASGVPLVRSALSAVVSGVPTGHELRWLLVAY